ncbi:uncharacterized protein Dwil_GK10087 [Drosophila willistoni]|uniref:ferroxidase n=1 Tax=Drosophila willistoni TaxID=7260 RepID=B4NCQ9_DROWI|nr:frataxin homolog, mitochondrial [Drosophila willistoni]EDW82618.1 uncharacterized protein Dwil_GK10087 [Drosophila willistoni]
MLTHRIIPHLRFCGNVWRSAAAAAAANCNRGIAYNTAARQNSTQSTYSSHNRPDYQCRRFYGNQKEDAAESHLDTATYERVCSETLDALCDYFEELTENANDLKGSDVSYGDGVLTVNLGQPHGTYVINRQTPNKQIWLSSPTSGPKRFDFVDNKWVYKHSGETLHSLLQLEIPNIIKSQSIDFIQLPYGS